MRGGELASWVWLDISRLGRRRSGTAGSKYERYLAPLVNGRGEKYEAMLV